MNNDYEFTGEVKKLKDIILRKIRRVSDNIPMGWIEKESNLSDNFSGYIDEDSNIYGEKTIISGSIVIINSTICNCVIIDNGLDWDESHTHIENSYIFNTNIIGEDNIIKGNNRIQCCNLLFKRVIMSGEYNYIMHVNMESVGCVVSNTRLCDFKFYTLIKNTHINNIDNDLISIHQKYVDSHIFTRISTYSNGDMYHCVGEIINSSGFYDCLYKNEHDIIKYIALSLRNIDNKSELFEKYRKVIKNL